MTQSSESGAVVVTNKDIYDQLMQVKEKLIEMSPQGQMLTDHEARLRSVEKWKYGLPASISTSVIAAAIALLDGRH
jgi:hypothetical protein